MSWSSELSRSAISPTCLYPIEHSSIIPLEVLMYLSLILASDLAAAATDLSVIDKLSTASRELVASARIAYSRFLYSLIASICCA